MDIHGRSLPGSCLDTCSIMCHQRQCIYQKQDHNAAADCQKGQSPQQMPDNPGKIFFPVTCGMHWMVPAQSSPSRVPHQTHSPHRPPPPPGDPGDSHTVRRQGPYCLLSQCHGHTAIYRQAAKQASCQQHGPAQDLVLSLSPQDSHPQADCRTHQAAVTALDTQKQQAQ